MKEPNVLEAIDLCMNGNPVEIEPNEPDKIKCDFCSKEAISALSHNMCKDHWNEYYEFGDRK